MLDVTVEVFDDQGTVQAGAQVVARPDETVAVTLVVAELDRDRFHDEPTVAPPFVVGGGRHRAAGASASAGGPRRPARGRDGGGR